MHLIINVVNANLLVVDQYVSALQLYFVHSNGLKNIT